MKRLPRCTFRSESWLQRVDMDCADCPSEPTTLAGWLNKNCKPTRHGWLQIKKNPDLAIFLVEEAGELQIRLIMPISIRIYTRMMLPDPDADGASSNIIAEASAESCRVDEFGVLWISEFGLAA